ncbi:hypothetical protein E2P81_ATG06167 [Venturia nashicola]|uniref:Uncharacterized protein n=1 Tax=Venturia nashicola TaxID=86259 RepID=A0A4Z1NXG9_9PEZI|nr:hypothetical protein E6O75_ATG06309 [Venturia nashicola]TLD27821.1 hypothetical protein E2P81_ATG06167 [Venturia nashicola]
MDNPSSERGDEDHHLLPYLFPLSNQLQYSKQPREKISPSIDSPEIYLDHKRYENPLPRPFQVVKTCVIVDVIQIQRWSLIPILQIFGVEYNQAIPWVSQTDRVMVTVMEIDTHISILKLAMWHKQRNVAQLSLPLTEKDTDSMIFGDATALLSLIMMKQWQDKPAQPSSRP